ncbi:hypothetical protein [Dyadobacter sp. 3J3]|uniref:hypothetical protein n=1 Tax=Dyadobacter sp. 3J3 TaxID=2606600 RepID=UPI0013571047|nr:hypothetical protein [Dyadobacter sp. 3J3]
MVPVFSFGIFIFKHALNVPYNDDEALLYSLNQIITAPSDSFYLLFEQQNDHRVFFSRLVSLIIKLMYGKMNFRVMIIFGYLNLVLLGYAFFLIFKSANTGLAYFIPVAVLLFSPIVYATHLWAITSFEYTLAITFSLYCLIFLQPSKQKVWYWSIPFAIAATVSNLDGLSVIPVGLVWLVTQKRKKESILFGIFAVLYVIIFFTDFHFSIASKFPPFPQIIGIVFKAFVSYCGSILKVLSDSYGLALSTVAGTFFLIVLVVINIVKFFNRSQWRDVLFPLSITEICFLELLACGLMIAIGRAGDVAGSMLAIRFQVYAVSTFILFYLLVLSALKDDRYKRYFFIWFLFCAIALNALSYSKYDKAIAVHNDELKVDSYNFPNHAFFLYQYTDTKDPNIALYQHYEFPGFFSNGDIEDWYNKIKAATVSSDIQFTIENLNHLPEYQKWKYPAISFQVKSLPSSVPESDVYLALFNCDKPGKPFLVAVRHENRNWLNKITKSSLAGSARSVIFPQKMAGKHYDVALCWKNRRINNSILVARNVNLDKIIKTRF